MKFTDGSHAIVRLAMDEAGVHFTPLVQTGDQTGDAGVNFAAFGFPAQSSDGRAAFTATLTSDGRQGDTAKFESNGNSVALVTREGDQALATDSAVFSAFTATVNDSTGRVAFTPTLRSDTIIGANDTAIFLQDSSKREGIARKGAQPPGLPAGKMGEFPVACTAGWCGRSDLPGQASDMTSATGWPNPARITTGNCTGVWAVDSAGELQLLARTGDPFDARRKVTGLTLLSNVFGSPAQSRSFTSDGNVVDRATLNDGSQHVVTASVP